MSDLDDVFLVGRLAYHHLVCHNAQAPNVYLLIVGALLELLGADVGQTADHRAAEAVGEDGAPEITDFEIALYQSIITSLRKTFSGFMSRWMMSSVCMYLSPSQICLM